MTLKNIDRKYNNNENDNNNNNISSNNNNNVISHAFVSVHITRAKEKLLFIGFASLNKVCQITSTWDQFNEKMGPIQYKQKYVIFHICFKNNVLMKLLFLL